MQTATGASGAVLRNSQSEVIAAMAKAYTNVADVLTAEALAARDGVLLALEHGAAKVILEMDSTQLVNLLRSSEGIYSVISGIWHEVTELCSLFSFVDFSYVPRGGNEVAHTCASMPSSSSPSFSWVGSLSLVGCWRLLPKTVLII
jgi:ribonuclease HI